MTDESSSSDSDGDDSTLADAVDEFLDRTDRALEDYDRGYADADATLRVLETHLRDLRDAAEE